MTTALLAPAKINLTLHVTGRRADGYHLLNSLVAFADIGDRISIAPAPDLRLHVTGPFAAGLPTDAGNLVLRAAQVLRGARTIGADVTLEKNLPVASGIGGGSSDAATTVLALSRLWNVPLDVAVATLGADIPVCLRRKPTRMAGIGEILTDVSPLPKCGIALVNPGVPLATIDVFRAFTGPLGPASTIPAAFRDVPSLIGYLSQADNVLAAAAEARVPAIRSCLAALRQSPDCLIARMSGSGPTCFGLFASREAAARADAKIRQNAPGWWIAHGELKPIPFELT